MLDLRTPAVSEWLRDLRTREGPDAWPPAIRPLEASPRAQVLLADFGDRLAREVTRSREGVIDRLSDEAVRETLRQTFAQLGAARALRIMHWLREAADPEGTELGNWLITGDAPATRAFRDCVTTVARQATLSRLTSPSRLDELATAAGLAAQEKAP